MVEVLSRVINHLLKDIASLTRYHPDTSSRLCFLLGAREAIKLMLAVKEASGKMYLIPNVPSKEKNIKMVISKILKDFQKQGYSVTSNEELNNTIMIEVRDRKLDHHQVHGNVENVANKYILDEIKHKGYPQVILSRHASIEASMGANIVSGDISNIPPLNSGDEVILMDKYYDIVGHGVADMTSEEIKRSPGRIAIRTLEGRYDVPKFHDHRHYRNGLYSVSTLQRILGVQIQQFDKEAVNILVICQDDGEVAVALLNNAPAGSKVFIVTRNENHRKAIRSNLERLEVSTENVILLTDTLDRFTKSRPPERFKHFYLELPSTESGKRPNPYFDGEEKNIISNARGQFSALRSIALVGENEAQISYITHSIDPTENEEVVVQAFRQGNYSPVEIQQFLPIEYTNDIHALPEIPTVTQAGSIDLIKMNQEEEYKMSWINMDPLKYSSDAGFVAKLLLNI